MTSPSHGCAVASHNATRAAAAKTRVATINPATGGRDSVLSANPAESSDLIITVMRPSFESGMPRIALDV
jgi:hypothetical protein